MKIIELRAENIKRLLAVTIRPDGNMVEITGKNGAGKTSVLDSIWWALEGQKNIQAVPIRKGATSAKIKLDMGELKVTRTFNASRDAKTKELTGDFTTSIVVENEQGARFPSPQAVIDGLLGALSFDPLAFTRMKPFEQLETLRRFVPDVDFDAIDRLNAGDFSKRTEVNRQAKDLRAREAGIVVPAKAPGEVDETALVAELEAAGKQNAELEIRKARREAATAEMSAQSAKAAEYDARCAKLRLEIEDLNNMAVDLRTKATATEEKLSQAGPLPEPVDTAPVKLKIQEAAANNRVAREAKRLSEEKTRLATQADFLEKQSDELTAAMEKRKADKAAAIAQAKMPIEGIGFGDGVVLMNGVPFEQASDAEQLRASIGIAAAMNPKLRVIRVRDGSLLDEDAMKMLAEFADTNDLQVWIERVDSSGRVGFVLEDGEVKEPANG